MKGIEGSVQEFLDGIDHSKRRRDAATLLEMMGRVTGETPRLWGTIIGFGQYHYKYESGHQGDAPAAGFSPRKAATTVYLADGVRTYAESLERLGPHTTGVGCLYIKDLEAVDIKVLESIVKRSYKVVTAGTFPSRAHEGGRS